MTHADQEPQHRYLRPQPEMLLIALAIFLIAVFGIAIGVALLWMIWMDDEISFRRWRNAMRVP